MKTRKSDIGGFLKGILIGGILGGTLALFTTPHSGFETRRLLREKGEQLRDKTMETIEDAREQVDSAVFDVRHSADRLVQRLG